MLVFGDHRIIIKYKPRADSPPLQASELTAQTLRITNIARLIDVPQLSTTFPVQTRIGNIPVYTYTHTHTRARMLLAQVHIYLSCRHVQF